MSLFRKPRKTIQRRVFSEQDDEELMDTSDDTHTNIKANHNSKTSEKTLIKINPTNTKQSLLSFETEEEGEVFQVKKSSHSKKMMRMYEKERRKREPKDIKKDDDIKSTDKYPRQQEIITDDFVVVVNTSRDTPPPPPPPPSITPTGVIISGKDALYVGKDDLSSEEESEDPEDVHINHRFSRPNNVKKVLESGAIPDAAMIHAARKRRQRAREQGEFIPVQDDEVEEKIKDTGRLVREDEHADNGSDDDDERIDMGANPAQRDQERRREQFYEAVAGVTSTVGRPHTNVDQDEDEDDVLHRWEDQQIRKGVTGASTTAGGLTQDMLLAVAAASAVEMNSATDILSRGHHFSSVASRVASEADLDVPCTPHAILDRLRQDYNNTIASRDQHKNRLECVHADLVQAAEELETLKLDGPRAAQRFRFYQELRGYVTDLVECLDEKISQISDLEQRAMEMLTKKSEWLIERRRQDVRDQADELANAGKGILGNGVRRAGGVPLAEDEDKLRRAVEREGRRTRRRKVREVAAAATAGGTITVGGTPAAPRHVQGMSSDDEMPPQECTELEKEHQNLVALVQKVFEDVVDDYSTVANILIKFEEWREMDIAAYNDAYATLCIPKIISPLIRLQLVFWDPLSESSEDFEKLPWYRILALYGLHDTETESSLSADPDVGLLPAVVEKLIVPKLTEFVQRCWDPVSTSQTLRLVGIATRCIRRFPTLGPDSPCLANLFKAILARIHTALEHDVFIPIAPKLTDAPRSPFFQRQFAGGLKLLRNITCWQGVLNDATLKELAVNKLLNRYLLNGIQVCQLTDAVAKLGLISHILPRVWLQSDVEHLKMFNNCVTNLAQQLDKNNPVHLESIDTLTNILKCKRM